MLPESNAETIARSEGNGYRLSGRKSAVYGGQDADIFLIAALLDGNRRCFRPSQ